MKKVIVRLGLLCAITLLFVTCSKIDWDFFRHQSKKDCDLQSYNLSFYKEPAPFLFKKKYNGSGDRITEIEFNIFSIVPNASPYKLRLAYHGLAIYLINLNNEQDTTMKIYLNAKGRVKECFGKFRIDYTKFSYDAKNRLSNLEYAWGGPPVFNDTCEYDQYGNILRIYRPFQGERQGSFYKYDYSKKGKRQVYLDQLSHSDDFTLLQYLGFFPELEPVHVRTRVWMGYETYPYWWDRHLANHQFDAKGRLIQYDVFNSITDPQPHFQAFLNWNCK